MSGSRKPPCRDKPSIKYGHGSLRGASIEIVDFGLNDYVSAPTANKQKRRTPEPRDSQICSTGELISALGSLWYSVTGPLSILVPKSTTRYESRCLQGCNILWYSYEDGTCSVHMAADNRNHPINLVTVGDSLPMLSGYLGFLNVKEKISFIQPSIGTNSLLRGLLESNDHMIEERLKERSFSNTGLDCYLHKAYGWMTERALPYQEHPVNFAGMEKHDDDDDDDDDESYTGLNMSDTANCHISVNENSSANNLIIENGDRHSEKTKLAGLLLGQNDDPNSSMKSSSATLWIEHEPVQDIETCSSKIPNSSLCADSLGRPVPSRASNTDESECSVRPDLDRNKINHQQDFSVEKNSKVEIGFPVKEKPNRALAKQEHAFAGAMAGIFVSLSLHPVDTIKTVVQSCRADQKSLHDICQSIISQRGITGLYRGISSNIASSAPISALYTFTYESIKGILLPFLPMGYQSVAHCMAGGCASIATSFIFTPSERIKQQMQISSRYQNCWNAFTGIIEKGGLPSLYTGWGAVLCRNVPHSVIKFYTYESLKQLLSSVRLDGQTNTFVTLVSGGLAASTAALFSTPFDVVKTRLQTQIPGQHQYPGVFDTLKDIARNEGLKGLYRGLTPRLFMYTTQGGLFFASYESLKRLFSFDGSHIKVQANALEKSEDDLHEDESSIM